ncbi:exopolysaccharide biosynthesis protein [Rhodobacteraceae bacterium]|nr:exopolysaccharide biosynthesis protein [Paracoccaceae bacterium]
MHPDKNDQHTVRDIVASIGQSAEGQTKVSIETVLNSLGGASFVPVLMVPALFVVSPLSGIPLFSSICGILITIISAQMLTRRKHLWLPQWLKNRTIDAQKVCNAANKLKGIARWLDEHTHERLRFFTHRPFLWITQGACMLCGMCMPFLELVPFSSSILGTAVVCLALSLLVRDGLIALLGMLFIAAAITVVVMVLTGQIAI